MPYIEESFREEFNDAIDTICKEFYEGNRAVPGILNYIITTIIWEYLASSCNIRYSKINEVIGVLECAKQELYRRIAAPYEDGKCEKNGDVYV